MQSSSSSTLSKIPLVLAAMAMAAGTIVESRRGTDVAAEWVYGSWWFVALLALVAVAAVVALVRGKYWREPHNLLIYASVPVILLGGLLTMTTGSHGHVVMKPGEPCKEYSNDEGKHLALPFTLTLEHFEVVTYPGSPTPMDFVSHVRVEDRQAVISMNNILREGGYRFYQEDYDGEGGSTLSVAHDPWGIGVTYAGYILLVIGMVWMFASRQSRFRRLLRGAAVLAMLLFAQTATAAPATIPRATAQKMGEEYVLYKGRVCPLQTLAKDFTTKLCGKSTYDGLTPEQVLAGWMFHFDEWAEEPMIKTKKGYFTYNALQENTQPREGKMNEGRRRMSADQEKVELVRMVANNTLLKIFPLRDSTGDLGWYSQNDDLPLTVDDEAYLFVRKQLGYCQELVVKEDYEGLAQVFEKTRLYQEKQALGELPPDGRIRAERIYNALTVGRWLPMALLTMGLIAFAFSLWGGEKSTRLVSRICGIALTAVTLYLVAVFVLRWVTGGHIPLAGGFDSMNFLSIVIGVVGLTAARKQTHLSLLAVGFCQLVAMMSGSNPPVTNLMPVLNSPMLTLHVAVIMMSYALFLFVALNSLAALLQPARREEARRRTLLMLYPAEALLALGIMIGAMWANISWGTYWSWDPKEVWALVTLIVYLFPLANTIRKSTVLFHVYCLVALLSVVITYFGVNLILGGMHAYGG